MWPCTLVLVYLAQLTGPGRYTGHEDKIRNIRFVELVGNGTVGAMEFCTKELGVKAHRRTERWVVGCGVWGQSGPSSPGDGEYHGLDGAPSKRHVLGGVVPCCAVYSENCCTKWWPTKNMQKSKNLTRYEVHRSTILMDPFLGRLQQVLFAPGFSIHQVVLSEG